MALEDFELPTSRMYNKITAFTKTADSDPVRSKTLQVRYPINNSGIA